MTDAAEIGYEVLSVSGGEPLLYDELKQILSHAKSCGMLTTVTTNGTLLDVGRCESLRGCLDLLAISLDGPATLHDEIRNSKQAFARLTTGLEAIRGGGIPFGFIHTLTRRSWEHLLWIAEFAALQGASLLQIHPLELAGRAAVEMRSDSPDEDILGRAFLLALALAAKFDGVMKVQFDAIDKESLLALPELTFVPGSSVNSASVPLAALVNPLVVEASGSVVPVSYGFSTDYQVCNLHSRRLREAWPSYVQHGYPAFRDFCRRVLTEVVKPSERQLFSWHELLVKLSREQKGTWSSMLATS